MTMKNLNRNTVGLEQWNVAVPKSELHPSGRAVVTKIATRNRLGQFHGSTNFRGSVLSVVGKK